MVLGKTHQAPAAWRSAITILLAAMFFTGLPLSVVAQQITLTAEQQRMLDQLPPAQKEQALAALRQMQGADNANTVRPLREEQADSGSREPVADPSSFLSSELIRADAGSRLVIEFTPKSTLSAAELEQLANDASLWHLNGIQAFKLDDTGVLSLPAQGSIPLLGLTETDIERRLDAEVSLSRFDISVRILEIEPIGVEALQPFGYDLFEQSETGFDPATTGPVPADYVLGPGDSVRIQLFGNINAVYELDVTRDGILNFPELGPVTAAGIPFSEFRQDVANRVGEMLIGTQASITMGQLRTLRVFVLGDVNRPGSYVVGGLATISSALYQVGGISRVGSMRAIQLKRNGKTVARLDLYDLLLKGDTSGDRRLQPGDVIFVPPIGATIAVGGAVKRPAIYETNGKATLADAIKLAGGLAPDAFEQGSRIERIDADGQRQALSVNLADSSDRQLPAHTGDVLIVPDVLPEFENTVTLSGHVARPGPYQWRPGMHLSDLVGSAEDILDGVDMNYVLIRRQAERASPVQALSANLSKALANKGGADDPGLQARDTVYTFSLAFGRQQVIGPLLDELRRQATHDAPFKRVQIAGHVRAPGAYPLESGMRVSDLIRAGGSLAETAYVEDAEITRYEVVDGQQRATELIHVNLAALLGGDAAADILLNEHDHLRIKAVPRWESEWSVSLEGEVRFPGEYRIRRGETLREIIDRAGGLTVEAFPEGAIFLRETLREQEQEQLEVLSRRVEADLASLSLESANSSGSDSLSTGRAILEQMRNTKVVGRLVIDPDVLYADDHKDRGLVDIELTNGDRLLVPPQSQVVTVIGEVQQNTSHVYREALRRDDYVDLSGGMTRRADKGLIYVVRASGAVVAGKRSRWFGRSSHVDIRPGDTIVVPLETDRIRPLTLWTGITQILYQAAIAVAAVQTFDD